MADFKVELLAELIMSGAYDQIKQLESQPVHLQVELDGLKEQTAEFKKLTKELKDYQKISKQQQSLPVGFDQKQINQITTAFGRLETSINNIQKAFGTLDDSANMQPMLASINSISSALSNTKAEFQSLSAAMNNMKFDIKFDFGTNKSSVANSMAYGSQMRRDVLPRLRSHLDALQNEFKGNEWGRGIREVDADGYISVRMLDDNQIRRLEQLQARARQIDADLRTAHKDKNLTAEADYLTQYINLYQELANLRGTNIDQINEQFAGVGKTYRDAVDTLTGKTSTEEIQKRLQGLFGGGQQLNLDGTAISNQLTEIVAKLGQVEAAITQLSTGGNLANLTTAFNNVSESLRQIVDDCGKLRSAFHELKQGSDNTTSEIIRNEEKKQSAYTATTENVMYHAGIVSKLNKAETNGRFYGSNRGTGYFGTGHYFVDAATKHELDNDKNYSGLPYTSIDISKYDNLFKVTNDEIGYALHSFLGNLTAFTQGSDRYELHELFDQFKNVFGDSIMSFDEFDHKVGQLTEFMSKSSMSDRSDSVSTQFMKSLGYGGVDTRGTKLADTRYGSVIYDLKEESILQANITDELQKQGQMLEKIDYERGQVFDQNEDNRIQGIIDEQQKHQEIVDEFNRSFDSTRVEKAESDLDNAEQRVKEIDRQISIHQDLIDNADKEFAQHAKELSKLGFDDDDILLDDDFEQELKEEAIKSSQRMIDQLSKEKAEIQSRIPILKDVYDQENKLAEEAYERAKQTVEQRRLETQQSTTATNIAVQNEEKKRQAMQQTYEAQEEYHDQMRNTQVDHDGRQRSSASQRELANAEEVSEAYKRMRDIQTEMRKLDVSLIGKDPDKDANLIEETIRQSSDLYREYYQLQTKYQTQFDKSQRNYLSRREKLNENAMERARAHLQDQKKIYEEEARIQADKDVKTTRTKQKSDDIRVTDNLKKIKVQTEETQRAYENYTKAVRELNAIDATTDTATKVQRVENYKQALIELEIQQRKNIKTEQQQSKETGLNLKKDAFASEIDVWANKNSEAAKHFSAELESIKMRIQECDATGLTNLRTEFTKLKRDAELAGKTTKSFAHQMRDMMQGFAMFFSLDYIVDRAVDGLRDMYQQVVEIDTAMTNLYKVTDESAARYEKFMGNASDSSKELGRSMSSYIEQTAEWSKLGYGLNDAEQLSKLSSVYANVGEVDDATAVSDMVTAMKAFNIESSEAIKIIDSLNKLGNEFAVTAKGLGSGMANSASAMSVAGVTFEQTMAMITGIAEITQSPDEAGSFLKVASMRIRGMKGALEELGEEVDENVDSISKVQTQILNLTGGKVNIFDQNGEFRNYYEIMQDIANVYDQLSSTEQSSLTEILFGKMRGNQGAAMLQAFQSGQITKAYEAAMNSAGSAMAEQAKWMESLEARIGKLKASWQSLSETFMSSDFLKGLMDFGVGFMDTIEGIIENIGVIPTVLTAVTAGLSLGDVGELIKQFHYAITLANEYAHEAA